MKKLENGRVCWISTLCYFVPLSFHPMVIVSQGEGFSGSNFKLFECFFLNISCSKCKKTSPAYPAIFVCFFMIIVLGNTWITTRTFSIFLKHGELSSSNQHTSNIYQKEIKLKPYNCIYTKLATPTISSWLALLWLKKINIKRFRAGSLDRQ